jgi:hypothetical protein
MFKSTQSKVIVSLGGVSILVSLLKNPDTVKILIQLIVFSLMARDADCMVYGECHVASWSIIIVPLLFITFFVMDAMDFFKPVQDKIDYVKDKIEKLNKIKAFNV